jgi:hypothetical protein
VVDVGTSFYTEIETLLYVGTHMSQTVAPIQVTALPIGSGGKSESAAQLNKMNTTMTMLSAQSEANTMYDPPPPPPATTPTIVGKQEGFCSPYEIDAPTLLCVAGVGFILYGLFAK